MTAAAKSPFGQRFEPGVIPGADEMARPLTRADVDAANAAGVTEGLRQGLASAEAAMAQTMATFTQAFQAFAARHGAEIGRMKQMAVDIALAVTAKLLPSMGPKAALAEMDALMRETLAKLREEPRVVIRVPEALADDVLARIEEITNAAGYPGSITLLGEPGLAGSDCRIEWADGGVERDGARLKADLDAAVSRCLAALEREVA
jgi:flagellar assembly protein FliH